MSEECVSVGITLEEGSFKLVFLDWNMIKHGMLDGTRGWVNLLKFQVRQIDWSNCVPCDYASTIWTIHHKHGFFWTISWGNMGNHCTMRGPLAIFVGLQPHLTMVTTTLNPKPSYCSIL